MTAYRDEMRRQQSEYKMNTISLVTQLYNTKEELNKVSIEALDTIKERDSVNIY